MSHCAPLPRQAVTITHLRDDAALVRLTGAPPIRSMPSLAVPGAGAAELSHGSNSRKCGSLHPPHCWEFRASGVVPSPAPLAARRPEA